jgi:hypothetical protein
LPRRGAQGEAAIEPPFLWILAFGIPTQSITAIKLIENVKAWSVELQLLPFKTAKAVLLQAYRFLNLMAVTQSMETI